MATSAPACRRCNYLVAGLPTLICPECGGDLRQIGIRVPGEPFPHSIAGPLFASVLMVFVPMVMISIVLSGAVGQNYVVRTIQFSPFWYEQQTSPVQSLSIACTGGGTCWNWGSFPHRDPVQNVTFQINVSGHPASTLQADIHGNCWIRNSPPHPLDAPTALAWLTKAGLNPASAQAHQLADDILASLPEIRTGGIQTVGFTDLQGNSQNYSGTFSGATNVLKLSWLFGCVIWAVLAWRVWRSRNIPIRGVPSCGHCGCEAGLFTDFVCPVCDSDPRQVGIRVSERHRWSGLAAPLFMCGLLTLAGGAIVGIILDNAFRQFHSSNSAIFISHDEPREKQYIQLVGISASASGVLLGKDRNSSDFPPDELTLLIQIKGHRPLTAFLERNGTCHFLANDGTLIERPWTSPTLLEMLSMAGLDPADKPTHQFATEILAAVKQSWAGAFYQVHFTGLDGDAGGSSSSSSGGAAWLTQCQWAVCMLVWTALAWRILRRQIRLNSSLPPAIQANTPNPENNIAPHSPA